MLRTTLARVRTTCTGDMAARSVRHRQPDVAVDALDDAHWILDRVAEVDVDESPGRQRVADGKTAIEIVLERAAGLPSRLTGSEDSPTPRQNSWIMLA